MEKLIKVTVRLYDSLDHLVTEYTTRMYKEWVDKQDWEEGSVIKDCEVDGELGFREYSL